ncbi:glutathione peroxidase [Demequina sp. TTPB684]|uniref:glutathione peroxidase n=1 Tax=unclassified Demequina TaxID=2620311 RepID=UPI001CF5ECB5|nr:MULTISPECIES: glutathione peroxidase [unclassified Demequina]MCB2412758.1 glutathione peroxidase [Demequina sp. TTPB684]UPU88865.1 glutathione peroxidase [Demequina sp. TMPB413]
MATLADFTATTLDGRDVSLSEFDGQVVLVVNTASNCGFTPQFAGLQDLHTRFSDKGFTVLGFPCNQFGAQEPGDGAQIGDFCQANYGVTFPMFAKVDVNGRNAHPLFVWLKSQRGGRFGSAIKWNFTKYLVDRNGRVIARYGSRTEPAGLAPDIESALKA